MIHADYDADVACAHCGKRLLLDIPQQSRALNTRQRLTPAWFIWQCPQCGERNEERYTLGATYEDSDTLDNQECTTYEV